MTLFQRLSAIISPPRLSLRDEVASTEEPPPRGRLGAAYEEVLHLVPEDTEC